MYIAIDSDYLSVFDGNKFYINIYYTTSIGKIQFRRDFMRVRMSILPSMTMLTILCCISGGIKTNPETDANRIFIKLESLKVIPGLRDNSGFYYIRVLRIPLIMVIDLRQ